jgi:protease I
VLAVDGFEQAELIEPQRALAQAGVFVHVISSRPGQIQS